MPSFKHTLTTPEVENKTTTVIKVRDINIAGLLEDNGPVAVVGITEGEMSGEDFVPHRSKSFRIEKATLETELNKTCNGTDDHRQCIERAVLDALVAAGHIAAGTIS
jgi:hypothetical protein